MTIPFESLLTYTNDYIVAGDGDKWPVWVGIESVTPLSITGKMLSRHALRMRIRTPWETRDKVYEMAMRAGYGYRPPGAWARISVQQEPSLNSDFETCADTSILVESVTITGKGIIMSEEVRESDMINGEDKVKAQIIRYEANTFNASAMMQMGQNAISNEPTVVSFIVGGLSKRAGIAMNVFGACLKENDGDIEEAVDDAFIAADLILEKDKEKRMETGLSNNDIG